MGQDTVVAIVDRGIKLVVFMPVMGITAYWLLSAWLERVLSFEESVVGAALWAIAFILGAISIVHGGWGFVGVLGSIYVLLLALAAWEYISARKMEQQHLQEEVVRYQQAIQVDSRNAAAYAFLGATYLKLSRFDEAETMLTKALELEPESRMERRLLAQARSHQPRLPRRWAD